MDQPVNRIMENDDNQQYQKQTEGTSNTTIQVKTNLQYQNLCLAHSDEIQVATDLPILPRSIATSQSQIFCSIRDPNLDDHLHPI